MSQENVEVVRAGIDAWNAGNMDAVRDGLDPNAVATPLQGWPEQGPFVGRDAVMAWYGQVREAWDIDTVEAIRFVEAGDRVMVRVRWHGTGQGPESTMEFTAIYTLRKGRSVYIEFFWDHAEALETLGLSEQDAHADS
jgi:ketosteroid isomerase-like protein